MSDDEALTLARGREEAFQALEAYRVNYGSGPLRNLTVEDAVTWARVRLESPARACTCHPNDNPPVPCPRKYAYTECLKAALDAARLALSGAVADADNLREEIARLRAPPSVSDNELARTWLAADSEIDEGSLARLIKRVREAERAPPGADAMAAANNICPYGTCWDKCRTEVARALEQHAAHAREQAIEDAAQIVKTRAARERSTRGHYYAAGELDEAETEIRALSSQPPQFPWRDIASAPKDGKTVIVPGGLAYWRSGHSAWYSITGHDWPGQRIQWEVKCWQPLPSPPQSDKAR